MKSFWMLACFLVWISLFLGSPASAEKSDGPKMVLTETAHDFNEVEEGAVLVHAFTVMNKGGQTLEIKNVNPG